MFEAFTILALVFVAGFGIGYGMRRAKARRRE